MSRQGKSVIHKYQSKFICNCNNYEATSKKALFLHIKYTHNIEKTNQGPTTYVCSTCKKEFEKNINLRNHIRKSHK